MAKHDNDNRANQLNPNNDAYWQARGFDARPDDWEEQVKDFKPVKESRRSKYKHVEWDGGITWPLCKDDY